MQIQTETRVASEYWWLFFVMLAGLVIWCAWPGQLYFLNDDYLHIPKACEGQLGQNNSLRPIGDLSLFIDSLWSGKNAYGYHLTNLLLHLLNMILAVPVFKKIAASLHHPVGTSVAVIIAGLFGVYAFHSEALFWILGRAASLSLCFNLLCWLCFFKALVQRWWLVPMAAFFLLGIFTYESLWVFPLLLLTWVFLLPKTDAQRKLAVWPIIIIWLLFIAYFPIRLQFTGALLGTYEANDVEHFNLPGLAEKTLKLYMRSFLPPMANTKFFMALVGAVIVGILLLGRLLYKRKLINKLLVFLVLCWLISYLPYVSLGVSVTGYESERYLYYPSLFLCAAIVYAGVLLWQHNSRSLSIYLSAVFMFHIFFFIRASSAFKKISSYSRNGMAAMVQVPLQKKIVIKDLPVYSHGQPVFNYGLMNGISWLAPGRDTLQVEILSKKRFEQQRISVAVAGSNSVADTIVFSGQ
ncbi:MAG: hypothetical protein V4722_10460 [Bacteroidota bacterium]